MDLTVLVNGIPTATGELKNPLTHPAAVTAVMNQDDLRQDSHSSADEPNVAASV